MVSLRSDRKRCDGSFRDCNLDFTVATEKNHLKVALVTGGASGIGLGISSYLAESGWLVAIADRDQSACQSAAETLGNANAKVIWADVATEEGSSRAVNSCIEHFGVPTLVCNNAGVRHIESLFSIDLESWHESFQVNVDAALLCSRSVLPHMEAVGGGSIVNIGSISGQVPYADGGAYATSKAALIMLTRVLAIEAGPRGVRVNCICPGSINRDEMNPTLASGHIPIGRAGNPKDVASLIAYLGSEEAKYVNGAIIALDGGATAGRTRVSN